MMKSIAYADQLCPRCGSKQHISKTWKETISTFSGTIEVDCSQIVCTNVTCQNAFDENLIKETKKKEDMRNQKDEREKIRKENAVQNAKLSRARNK